MKYLVSIYLFSALFTANLFAGEHPKGALKTFIISGKVTDTTSNELLAGVKIECDACQKTVYSDLDGRFFMYLQVDATQQITVEFTQVGYAAKTLTLQDIGSNLGNLEINLANQ